MSIEKALSILIKENGVVYSEYEEAVDVIEKALADRPHGKWIELPKALNSNELPCQCSNCEHVLSFMNYYPKSNFCPNCGSDNRKEPAP